MTNENLGHSSPQSSPKVSIMNLGNGYIFKRVANSKAQVKNPDIMFYTFVC